MFSWHSVVNETLRFAVDYIRDLEAHSTRWSGFGSTLTQDQTCNKIVSETALLLLIVKRAGSLSGVAERNVRDLAAVLSKHARTPAMWKIILRSPQAAYALSLTHVVLRDLGYPDENFDRLLISIFDDNDLDFTERLPFRAMNVRWVRSQYNRSKTNCQDLLAHSILIRNPSPFYMHVEDVYALTHDVMFATDFGRQPLPQQINSASLACVIRECVLWHIVSGNWDVLIELLLSAELCNICHCRETVLAYHLLAAIWNRLTFIPGPMYNHASFEQLPGNLALPYAYLNIYHSTFVFAILGAVLVARGQPDLAAVRVESTHCDPRLTDVIDTSARRSRHHREWADLVGDVRADLICDAACAGGLTDEDLHYIRKEAALILAARVGDLETLAVCLEEDDRESGASRSRGECRRLMHRQRIASGVLANAGVATSA